MGIRIVLGKLITETEVISTDGVDLGKRPKTRLIKVPQTINWLYNGTDEDVKKALAFGEPEGYSVFTYPESETDPLGRCKREMLAMIGLS